MRCLRVDSACAGGQASSAQMLPSMEFDQIISRLPRDDTLWGFKWTDFVRQTPAQFGEFLAFVKPLGDKRALSRLYEDHANKKS